MLGNESRHSANAATHASQAPNSHLDATGVLDTIKRQVHRKNPSGANNTHFFDHVSNFLPLVGGILFTPCSRSIGHHLSHAVIDQLESVLSLQMVMSHMSKVSRHHPEVSSKIMPVHPLAGTLWRFCTSCSIAQHLLDLTSTLICLQSFAAFRLEFFFRV